MTCTYLPQVIVSLKITGPKIILALAAYQTQTFTRWSGTSWVKYGFYELQ
jgi:hypothetical protein